MQQNRMLREERKMDESDIIRFLTEAKIGRLGICRNSEPYVVPVLFVYDVVSEALYVHSSRKGMKIETMRINPKVCFEIDEMSSILIGNLPCNYDVVYRSAIIFGEAVFINDSIVKAKALNMFMEKYADETNNVIVTSEMTNNTQIVMIKICSKTGKENKGNRKNRNNNK